MTAPITEADREAARGLLAPTRLAFYAPDSVVLVHPDNQLALEQDVETAAQVIADARKTERDKWIEAAERIDSDGVCILLCEMGVL